MKLGIITMGNMNDVKSAVRQGKKVCAVYDREASQAVRSFIAYPSEDDECIMELIGNVYFMEYTDEIYYTALELYGHYDKGVDFCDCQSITNAPCLVLCSQDVMKQSLKPLALLQSRFDCVFIL